MNWSIDTMPLWYFFRNSSSKAHTPIQIVLEKEGPWNSTTPFTLSFVFLLFLSLSLSLSRFPACTRFLWVCVCMCVCVFSFFSTFFLFLFTCIRVLTVCVCESVLERVLQCVSVIRCGFSSTKLKLNELKDKNSWHMCVVCLCERKWIDLRNCFDRLEPRNHLTLEPDYFVLQKKREKTLFSASISKAKKATNIRTKLFMFRLTFNFSIATTRS